MVNTTEQLLFQLPDSEKMSVSYALFGYAQQVTGGLYINIFLAGFGMLMFTGGMVYGQGARKSSLFASTGTFILTFLLTLLSGYTKIPIAGGNQLIPAAVIFMATILWNYMAGGGAQL